MATVMATVIMLKIRKKRNNMFFKKKTFSLKSDIHSHILPAVDDGASSVDESLEILKELYRLGFDSVVLTPHVIMDAYNNSTQTILNEFEKLNKAVNNSDIKITIKPGAEYYIDEGFEKLLNSGDVLTFGENYLLFETSYVSKPLELEEIIFQMIGRGYKPVMAHPERYGYMNGFEDFKELKNSGLFFQININSFAGYYGKTAMKNAMMLAKEGMVDFLGTDTHRLEDVFMVKKVFESKRFNKAMQSVELKN